MNTQNLIKKLQWRIRSRGAKNVRRRSEYGSFFISKQNKGAEGERGGGDGDFFFLLKGRPGPTDHVALRADVSSVPFFFCPAGRK